MIASIIDPCYENVYNHIWSSPILGSYELWFNVILGTRFSEFAARYARDPRFLIIDKMRERENLFFGYKKKAQKKKEQDEAERKEKIKNNFE